MLAVIRACLQSVSHADGDGGQLPIYLVSPCREQRGDCVWRGMHSEAMVRILKGAARAVEGPVGMKHTSAGSGWCCRTGVVGLDDGSFRQEPSDAAESMPVDSQTYSEIKCHAWCYTTCASPSTGQRHITTNSSTTLMF